MWFQHYKPIPLGNDFQVFVFFGFLICFLKGLFCFPTFISIQIYCTVLVSFTFLLEQFLEPPSFLPFLSMFETSFN